MEIIILSVIAIFILGFVIGIYNNIVRARNQINNALSALDAQLIKRNDLIPNLVTSVKQYMNFESGTLDKITQLRSNNTALARQETQTSQTMKGLFVQAEAYPELKSDTQFSRLQATWNEAEEQIAAGRRFISSAITDYNNTIMVFPSSIVAGMMGAKPYEWQRAQANETLAPDAQQLFK